MSSSIIASVITGGTNSHQTVAEELNTYATDFVTQGVVGTITSGPPMTGSFGITQDSSPDMGVTALLGQAYVLGTPSGQDSQVIRARMTANYTEYTISSNSSGSTKYDWIYLQLNATNASTPDSAADNVINLYTSRSTSNASDNGSPPTYGLILAVVTVANGASSITNANIADKRIQAVLSPAVSATTTTGWNSLNYALTYSSNIGYKEFTCTTPNNLTGLLSPGMKLSISRSVSPPTQCAKFVSASSEYATNSSPSGITFTSAFTCEAWVKLTSYASGGCIISRRNASVAGWEFQVNSSGQVDVFYLDGSSNITGWNSYQSIPLNTWVHVAAVVSSTSGKTLQGIYINGLSVITQQNTSNAASLSQAGNLSVGAYGAGTGDFLNGETFEVRVWSVAQTQANIQANMALSISGASSNLVAYFQENGDFLDGTSNSNNLTATNGAIATTSDNPYNATEYSTILSVSYANPTSTITVYTGDTCTMPNMTLNSPQYSSAGNPYGLPPDLKKYKKVVYLMANQTTTSPTSTSVNGLSVPITVPVSPTKVKATWTADSWYNSGANFDTAQLFTGSAAGVLTTQFGQTEQSAIAGSDQIVFTVTGEGWFPSGSTYVNAAWKTTSGTMTLAAGAVNPSILEVEVDI